jgi:hypothetical protein
MRRLGYTMKAITRPAIERNEDERAAYKLLIGEHYEPHQLVFADESAFNRITLRCSFAWSLRGDRARRREFFVRGTK